MSSRHSPVVPNVQLLHDGNASKSSAGVAVVVATVQRVTVICAAAGGQSSTVAVEGVVFPASGKQSRAPLGIKYAQGPAVPAAHPLHPITDPTSGNVRGSGDDISCPAVVEVVTVNVVVTVVAVTGAKVVLGVGAAVVGEDVQTPNPSSAVVVVARAADRQIPRLELQPQCGALQSRAQRIALQFGGVVVGAAVVGANCWHGPPSGPRPPGTSSVVGSVWAPHTQCMGLALLTHPHG